ncbi:MAG: sugar ABC transporter substrate-binding protein [Actinomycetia bacterium]|nr:sugar ABC transporter substrate-binding protein [Actinomycetes bacterium]
MRRTSLLSLVLALALIAAACGGDEEEGAPTTAAPTTAAPTTAAPTTAAEEPLRIAFFASSSQNGYNQAQYEGVQRAAREAGNVETEIFDGEFNAELQFNQIEDVVASGRFDGYVITPNDPVGIVPAAEQALESGPTAATLFPIGPDLESLEPQIPGMITSAGSVTVGAEAAAELVVDFCVDIDPCRVIIIMGQLQFPFDNLRLVGFEGVLNQHDNIEILAVGEGQYSQDVSLTTMQDLLQAHPEFEVLLSNADQHVTGALVALEDAGVDIEPMWISGGGASTVAIEGIRAGIWDTSSSNFPVTEGYLAAQSVIAALRGESYEQVHDINVVNPLGVPMVTAKELDENPNWEAEWDG